MFDAACPSEAGIRHQRAIGQLRVALRRRGEVTALAELRQQGCLKARFPRSQNPGWIDVVTLNSSGGIAGGDVLDTRVTVQAGGCATVAAQAAERFYRALPEAGPARVRTGIVVGEAAAMEWLPQESILFDRCALDRTLNVELAEGSWFLGVESLVFGRAAMGEQVSEARLQDRIRISRGDRVVFNDAVRLQGAVAARLARPAAAGGARAMATVLLAAPEAAASLDRLRGALRGGECGVSAWDGLLVARILAPDGQSLRSLVLICLQVLRAGRKLPRVWMC